MHRCINDFFVISLKELVVYMELRKHLFWTSLPERLSGDYSGLSYDTASVTGKPTFSEFRLSIPSIIRNSYPNARLSERQCGRYMYIVVRHPCPTVFFLFERHSAQIFYNKLFKSPHIQFTCITVLTPRVSTCKCKSFQRWNRTTRACP